MEFLGFGLVHEVMGEIDWKWSNRSQALLTFSKRVLYLLQQHTSGVPVSCFLFIVLTLILCGSGYELRIAPLFGSWMPLGFSKHVQRASFPIVTCTANISGIPVSCFLFILGHFTHDLWTIKEEEEAELI